MEGGVLVVVASVYVGREDEDVRIVSGVGLDGFRRLVLVAGTEEEGGGGGGGGGAGGC